MDGPGRDVLGRRGVSRREAEVLDAVAERLTNAEIAARLHLSERTVESHVSSLLHKLGATNRIDLARRVGTGGTAGAHSGRLPYQLQAIAERAECVGRDDELRRLMACWDRSAGGTTVVVVRGEAGIGKSRLAAAVAIEVVGDGGRVALGRCVDGPQRPYEPFIAAIESDLARLPYTEPHRHLDSVDPEHERGEVYAALHDYLSRAARQHRLLLIVEDLHWASAATRGAVAHIARLGGEAPLMLLVTTRDEGPNDSAAFSVRLEALPSVEVVALAGLDVAAAASVIDAVGGDLDPDRAVRETGGNPLFLRELARGGERSRSLRELVAARFDRFSSGDVDVLDVATVAGEQIDVALVASTLERSTDDVLDTLERAEAVGLIGAGARPGRFAFTHDVFRSVRYASLTSSRKMRLHAAIAHALGRRPTGERDIGERALHACLAGPRFDPMEAAELALRAGDAASDATDHGAAAEHYRRAVLALDLAAGVDDGVRLDVSIRFGAALVQHGDAEGRTMLEAAGRTAQQRGEWKALARAVCAMAPLPGASPTVVVPDPVFRSLAEAALDALPANDAAWRTRVLAALGNQLAATDAPERGTEMVREAVRAARRLDDPVVLGRALLSYRWCDGPMELDARLACGTELVELGDRLGVHVFSYVGRQQLWWCYRELGDREQMDYWYAEAAARMRVPDAEQLSQPPAVALLDGDLTRAEQLTDVLGEAWDESGLGHVYAGPLRFCIDVQRGRIRDPVELGLALPFGFTYTELQAAIVAWIWARTGRLEEARALLDAARRRGFSLGYAARGGASTASCWAEVAWCVQDASSARQLTALFEPIAGRFVDNGVSVSDTVDRVRAVLRLVTGDPVGAADVAAGAIAASRLRRTPILLARELIVLAGAQQRLGIDDVDDLVEEAFSIARRTGARLIMLDARLYLTGRPGSHPPDQFGLTRREREVVDLVASGATNSQVATALGISPATVRKHLEHAYAKLDVSTRTAAARAAEAPR